MPSPPEFKPKRDLFNEIVFCQGQNDDNNYKLLISRKLI